MLAEQGGLADALETAREAAHLLQEVAGNDPAYLSQTLMTRSNLAESLRAVGRPTEALPLYEQNLEDAEQIAEIQTQPPSCGPDSAYGDDRYGDGRPPIDPFAAITGLIIGGILSHQRYDHYRSGNSYEERMFMERQLRRENGWMSGRGDFQRQWQDPSWRQQQQTQPYFWGQPGQIMPHHGNHGRGRDMIPGLPFDPRQLIPGLTGRGNDRRYDPRYDQQRLGADSVDVLALKQAGLVGQMAKNVKVIKSGELTRKVALQGIGATAGAKAAIEAAGGSIAA